MSSNSSSTSIHPESELPANSDDSNGHNKEEKLNDYAQGSPSEESHINDKQESHIISDNNESSSSDTEEEDEEEDEDSPPLLKYSRILSLPQNLFHNDPISTCTFSLKYYFFATHTGKIHITTPELKPLRTFKAHRASILSLYTDGNYFASGSMDGTVVIGSIEDESDITAYDFQRPIHGVVLEPNYNRGKGFITGGMSGKVIYTSKNWLGKRLDIIIEEGNGPIVSLQLMNDMIIWMNDFGITISQLSTRQLVKKIKKPKESPRSDLYWPKVSFPESDRILIGWGNYIWMLRVSIASSNSTLDMSVLRAIPSSASFRSLIAEKKQVSVEYFYKMDTLISGITTFKDDLWLVLAYFPPDIDEKSNRRTFHNPEIRLINSSNGEVEFEEELGMKYIENLGLNDYSLTRTDGSPTQYFIMSAKDGIIVQEYQLQDRLDWFISKGQYLEAWEISLHLVSWKKRLGFGISHVDNLIKENKWSEASQFLSRLLSLKDLQELSDENEEKEEDLLKNWEVFANIFIDSGHIPEITDIIPENIRISSSIYQLILEYWLEKLHEVFYKLIDWNSNLFHIKKLQNMIELKLENEQFENDNELRTCLTNLYERSNDYHKAIPHLIKLRDPNLMEYLYKHHIVDDYIDKLPLIVSLRFGPLELKDDSFQLTKDEIEERIHDIIVLLFKLDRDKVVKAFQDKMEVVTYLYFKEEGELGIDPHVNSNLQEQPDKYDDLRISLYSKYNRLLILPFLQRKGKSINIQRNVQLFQELKFWEELIYLYEEIGEVEKCITIIIDELDDENLIIKFLRNRKTGNNTNETSLWNQLIEKSTNKPKFIKKVLENLGEEQFNSPDIISKLKEINFNGLNKSLSKVFDKMEMSLLTNQIILKIINFNSNALSQEFRTRRLAGSNYDSYGLDSL